MGKKKKLIIAYILWAINAVTLFVATSILGPEWIKNTLSIIWLLTLPIAITFSILGHWKTKDQRVRRREDRRNSKKYSIGRMILVIMLYSFIMTSIMALTIVGVATESVSLMVVGISLEIVMGILLLIYFVYKRIKHKEESSLFALISAAVGIVALIMFMLYVLGVEIMSYPLVIITGLVVIIMAIVGNSIEDSSSLVLLADRPFQYSDSGALMAAMICMIVFIPGVYFIMDRANKKPPVKNITVHIDENGNKKIIKEVEE